MNVKIYFILNVNFYFILNVKFLYHLECNFLINNLHPINNLSVIERQGIPGLSQFKAKINVLAQGHNTVTPVRLEPVVPRS